MALSAAEWGAELSASLGYTVRVEFSRSRSTPIQLRHARPAELREEPGLAKGWIVRLHAVFADAPPEIRADLTSWIRVGRRARRANHELSGWMELAIRELPARTPRQIHIKAQGDVHDLDSLAAHLLETEFISDFSAASPAPPLTWGRRGKSQTRGRLQLGSFNPTARIVRIHPVLDQEVVPAWFVRYVLFHELLHAAVPSERDTGGRMRHHGPKFLSRENLYCDYPRALEWERLHLGKILRSARAGRPLRTPKTIAKSITGVLPFGRPKG
ncbi:MAG: hypothetical protein ACI8X5_001741 [Planctomycetota bacterium]|jgi:hypothetical protein